MKELLSQEGKDIFEDAIFSVFFNKGEMIFKEKSPVNQVKLVQKGLVKLCGNHHSQKPLIIKLTGSGKFIELSSIFNSKTHSVAAIAVEETIIQYIDIDTFLSLYYNNPAFNEEISKAIACSNQHLLNQLIARSIKRLPGRVADAILYFYELNNQSLSFSFPLSRQKLAQLIGTTKESLIRTLTEF